MNSVQNWPYRWFGVWAEYGSAYAKCPNAKDFVFPEINRGYDKARLRHYLTTAPIVASTSRINFPNPFNGNRVVGSVSFRTDGTWLWLDDIADYIDQHGVALPAGMLEYIESQNYTPPAEVPESLLMALEWPPT